MFCGKCGNELTEGEKFCPKCGTKTETEMQNNEVQQEKKAAKKKINPIYFIVGGVLLLAFLGIIIFINTPGYKYSKYLKAAAKAAEQEDYQKATELYEKAYYVNDNPKVLTELEYVYDARLKELMEADVYDAETQEEIDAIFDSKSDIWKIILEDLGDYDEMLALEGEDCVWIISVNKTQYFFEMGQADQKYAQGQYEEALQQYEEILSQIKSESEDYIEELNDRADAGIENSELALARQLVADRQYAEAVEKYDRVLAMNPCRVEAYLGKTNICLYQGDVIAAVDVLKTGEKKCEGTELQERREYIIANSIVKTKWKYNQRDGEARSERPNHAWEYNANGQVVREGWVGEDGKIQNPTTYTYDDAGNIILKKEDERTYRYIYDEHGRLLQEDYMYNTTHGVRETYTYDADGVLLEVHCYEIEDDVVTETGYAVEDSSHRLVQSFGRWQLGNGFVTMAGGEDARDDYFKRDTFLSVLEKNNILDCVHDDNFDSKLEYNENGRISRVVQSDEEGVFLTVDFEYYESGTLAGYTIHNMVSGDITVQTYNDLGFPVDTTGKYEYNDLGEIVWREDQFGFDILYYTYGYDDNHRLIYYCISSTQPHDVYGFLDPQQYSYWKTEQSTRTYETEYIFTYDDQGRLVSQLENKTQEYVAYHDSGSNTYRDANGMLHTYVGGNYYQPEFYFKSSSYEKEYSYVACDADDPEKTETALDIVNVNLTSAVYGLQMDPNYYTYQADCKLTQTVSDVKETYNEFGDVETSRISGQNYKTVYEYDYLFTGVIE